MEGQRGKHSLDGPDLPDCQTTCDYLHLHGLCLGQRNCRGSPWEEGAILGRTQDVSSCRRGGPGRPANPPPGELGSPLGVVMGRVSYYKYLSHLC